MRTLAFKILVLAALAAAAIGCQPKSATAPAAKTPETQVPAPETAAQNTPAPVSSPRDLSLSEAISALRSAGFAWDAEEPVGKDVCRTDEGCVAGQNLVIAAEELVLIVIEFDSSNPRTKDVLDDFRKKNSATRTRSGIVASNIAILWTKRTSYENEEKAREAINRAANIF